MSLDTIDLNLVDLDAPDLGSQLAAPAARWQEAMQNSFDMGGFLRYHDVIRLDSWQDSIGHWYLEHNSDSNGSSNRSVPERAMIAHFQNQVVQNAQRTFLDNLTNVILPQVSLNFTERAWLKRIYDEYREPLRAPEPALDFHIIENGMIRLD